MTGRITHTPTPQTLHDRKGCDGKPDANMHARGTIWTCDDCGKQWVVVQGAQYNESYSAWRVLTDRNREGYDG